MRGVNRGASLIQLTGGETIPPPVRSYDRTRPGRFSVNFVTWANRLYRAVSDGPAFCYGHVGKPVSGPIAARDDARGKSVTGLRGDTGASCAGGACMGGGGESPTHRGWFSWAIRRGLCCCGMVGLSVSVFLVFPTVCRLAWWCVVGSLRVLASFLFPVFGGDEV